MIGYLEGQVLQSSETKLILKTSDGVGREIFFKETSQKEISLYISQVIKEKSIEFYGFENFNDKSFFEKLLSVNGVGPKSAYSLMTNLGVEQLCQSIALEDVKTIKKAPGIGPKAAKQIILDLKDKIANEQFTFRAPGFDNEFNAQNSIVNEAVSAFKELGFQESLVHPLIKASLENGSFNKSEDLIKDVLVKLNN